MDTSDILRLYATYNKHANSEMARILGTLPEARIHEAAGSYYKSVAGLLDHCLKSTVGSLTRMATGGFLPGLITPALAGSEPPQGEKLFSTLSAFADLRAMADDTLIAVCAAATVGELDKTFSFTGRDKQQKTLSFGGNLLALFAHEIHHRGGVSVILDGWGVENDWSGLMRFLFL